MLLLFFICSVTFRTVCCSRSFSVGISLCEVGYDLLSMFAVGTFCWSVEAVHRAFLGSMGFFLDKSGIPLPFCYLSLLLIFFFPWKFLWTQVYLLYFPTLNLHRQNSLDHFSCANLAELTLTGTKGAGEPLLLQLSPHFRQNLPSSSALHKCFCIGLRPWC